MLGYSEEYKYTMKIQNNSCHTSKLEQHVDALGGVHGTMEWKAGWKEEIC
jgi:hypothetical protein